MNIFPSQAAPRRLAIVSETGHGANGYLIDSLVASAGINRDACFFGIVSPRPGLKFDSDEVQASIAQLKVDLATYQPHFVLILDRFGLALRLFAGEKRSVDSWRGSLFESPFSNCKCLCTYHPSRLQIEYGLTRVARFDVQKAAREMLHDELNYPARVIDVDLTKEELLIKLAALRTNSLLTHLDIEGGCSYGAACIGFSTDPSYAFVVPFYGVDGLSVWSKEDELELWVAVEGVLSDPVVPKCIMNSLYEMFVLAWTLGIVIVGLTDDLMLSHYELYCELEKALDFQASIYTNQPHWKLEHRNVNGRYVPYRNGKPVTSREWFIYNGTDCCVTCECHNIVIAKLKPKQLEHYRFNVSMLVPIAYMSLRGIKYDKAAAERRLTEVQQQIYEKQDEINREACRSRPELAAFYEALSTDVETVANEHGILLAPLFAQAFCKARHTEEREIEETSWQPCRWNGKKWVKAGKRYASINAFAEAGGDEFMPEVIEPPEANRAYTWLKPIIKTKLTTVPVEIRTFEDVQRFAKDSCANACKSAIRICTSITDSGASPAVCGQLATLLDLHVKINSTSEGGDAQWYLYEHCQLPKQYQKDGNKLTTKLASDDEAIIKTWVSSKDSRALTVLKMRKLVTQSKFLKADSDADGRIRFGFNLVGTPTGRMAAYGSPTGTSDVNPQTWTKKMRDLLVADSDCWIGTLDLAGSDGFSVAAYAQAQGDSTMMDDLKHGLKVAKIIALMMKHGLVVNTWSRDQLKEASKAVSEEAGPEYPTAKVIQHMSSYQGGSIKMSDSILINSVKKGSGEPIYVEPAKCKAIQRDCFFGRYPGILRWHEWGKRELKSSGMLIACNGFQRRFYGRKDDNSTLKEFLASMPQTITTYAILLTVFKQWKDPENRRDNGSLRIEPLLLVHDSNTSQWRKDDTEFAAKKLKEYFDNPVTIAGTTLTIPAGGGYGPNWMTQDFTL